MIEVCSPETVIMLNIQNEDCFISNKNHVKKRFRSVRQASPMTIVSLHKAGVWTARREIQLVDRLPSYQAWSLSYAILGPCSILYLSITWFKRMIPVNCNIICYIYVLHYMEASFIFVRKFGAHLICRACAIRGSRR